MLYGSRADGSATPDSDYDVAAFAPIERTLRDARLLEGAFLDVFIYPEAQMSDATEEFLKLRQGKVVLQRNTDADEFLTKLEELFHRGPQPLPPDEIEARRVWALKMSARSQRGDVEGNYRRVWLLYALLEDYFMTRGMWYQGPKKALQWLRAFDEDAFGRFSAALAPGASQEFIHTLAQFVARGRDA